MEVFRMRIVLVVIFAAALALVLPRPIVANITGTATNGNVVIQLGALSGSGQTGTATLTSTIDNKTQVVLQISGEPPGAEEPAHIHTGTCKKLNPKPAYLLENVVGGASTTTVNASLVSLETGHFSVNVHQSTANIGTYVACGTIPATAQPQSVPSTTPQPVSTYRPKK
jgi:hypothetical protein